MTSFLNTKPGKIFEAMDASNTVSLDFSPNNSSLYKVNLFDTAAFSEYVNTELAKNHSRFGIGGYNEHREIYKRSQIFNQEEPRCIHLGIDVWTSAGTEILAPLNGYVHSFKNNDNFGDYGPTIILNHQIENKSFYTLYGHLDLDSLTGIYAGKPIKTGEIIARVGNYPINGNWPPHLHFQLIIDLQGNNGDYPGVCKVSERANYLKNCPDPAFFFPSV
jgi:peptidoglycan LD-endopeptidase LytH